MTGGEYPIPFDVHLLPRNVQVAELCASHGYFREVCDGTSNYSAW